MTSDVDQIRGTDWSPGEIDLIVGDYFEMLGFDLAGTPYGKAQHNASLHRLTGRTRGSIERKHQNISAILRELGEPWIPGYKPLVNYQKALLEGIERFLDSRPITPSIVATSSLGFSDKSSLFYDAPPSLIGQVAVEEEPALKRLVRKFDPAARDARNRALGRQGEKLVFHHEQAD